MSSLAHASLQRPSVLSLTPHPWPSLELWTAHSLSPRHPQPVYPIPHSTSDSTYCKVDMSNGRRLPLISFVPCSLSCCLPWTRRLSHALTLLPRSPPFCMTIAGGYFSRLAQRCSAQRSVYRWDHCDSVPGSVEASHRYSSLSSRCLA